MKMAGRLAGLLSRIWCHAKCIWQIHINHMTGAFICSRMQVLQIVISSNDRFLYGQFIIQNYTFLLVTNTDHNQPVTVWCKKCGMSHLYCVLNPHPFIQFNENSLRIMQPTSMILCHQSQRCYVLSND